MDSIGKSFLDILESYRPESKTVSIELPCRSVLVFKTLGGYTETQQMYEEGARWYLGLKEMNESALQAIGMAGLVPRSVEDAGVAYTVSALSVDPKITPSEACVMVLECGDLARYLMKRIEAASRTMSAVRLAGLVEDAKKNLAATKDAGDGSCSGCAEGTSQADCQSS